ncbi:MAG: hypothetical protein P9L94_10735 [Candidatus Hinthialibacter antarcticus]|nr:hypothetical protein [Candidatus Hinthialibacter antarcticus]
MKIEPEDQQRYRIDEDMPEEEIKILSEAQSYALQKLIQNAGHVLSGEEREIVMKLVDKLNLETERFKSLRKMTVGDKPLDAFLSKNPSQPKTKLKVGSTVDGGDHSKSSDGEVIVEEDGETEERRPEPKVTHIVGFKPEEVVQRYIECWNQQKFGAEFDCFSRDFMQISREQYIDARHASFKNSLANGGMRVDFKGFDSSDVIGGEAEVIAAKSVKEGNKAEKTERDLYRLKLDHGRWVIYTVQPQ